MKKNSYPLLHLILLGLVISACASTQSAQPTQSQGCQPPIEWKIEFTLSGGLAGQSHSLSISSDGSIVVQDLRKEEKHESTISQDEIKKIAAMLTQACPFESKRTNSRCADCFVYMLNVSMNGKQYSLDANDLNIPESSAPLIGYLGSYFQK